MKPLHFAIAATCSGLLTINPMLFQQPATAASCVTWANYSRNLPAEGGRGNQWKAFGDLPAEFQNGCVLLQNNNSLDVAYVLKKGISPQPYIGDTSQTIPSFTYEQGQQLDRLVSQGKALQVTWLTPTNGAIPYLNSIPKNKPFLRSDGMTCFNTVCMKSGALNHQQLGQILSRTSAASGRPTSSKGRYPAQVIKNFVDACTAGRDARVRAVCSCAINDIQDRYSLEEFTKIDAAVARGAKPPQAMIDMVIACGSKV